MYRGLRTALWALAILAILGATAGAASAQAPHLQPKTTTGAISGQVTDPGGAPLEGIRVDAYQQVGGLGDIFAGFASTDASGNYRVSGLGDGEYKVAFSDPSGGYTSVYYDAQPSSRAANAVYVTGGGETGGIDEVMFLQGVVAGTVTDASGAPLANVQIKIYTSGALSELAGSAMTDAGGSYSVDDLLFGDYTVAFLTSCGTCNSDYVSEYYADEPDNAHADPVTVTAGATTVIDASLARAGSISGTVTDADTGQPIVETNAIAYRFDPASGTWVWARGAITYPGGVYTIDRLAPGDYKVFFNNTHTYPAKGLYSSEYYDGKPDLSSADLVTVTADADTPGIDGTLTYLATGSISGMVTDASGAPLAGIDVQLYGHQTGDWYAFGNPVQTDAAGHYQITGLLADDDYKVEFSGGVYAPEYYDDAPTLDAASLVAVATDADTPGIDASLAVGGSIAGTVTDELGAPIQGIEVAAYSGVGGGSYWWQESATTDGGGHYFLPGLADGVHKVQFLGAAANYVSELYDDQPDLASADPVTIAGASAVTGIDAVLASAGNAIAGTLTDTGGQLLAGIEVRLFQENPSTGARDPLGSFATTDAGGHYQVVGLASGDYEVEFVDPAGTYALQFYDGESDLASATPVPAIAGSVTSGIDASLSGAGAISGTVTNTLGQPLRSVPISLYRRSSSTGSWNPLGVQARTDAGGVYLAPGLPEGDYKVELGSGAASVFYRGEPDLDSADPVRVSTGATTSGIDAVLDAGGSISGAVRGEGGQPLEDAQITVYADQAGFIFPVRTVATDAVGNFRASGLPAGAYRVLFAAAGGYLVQYWDGKVDLGSADPVTVAADGDTSGIDATLDRPGAIEGTVTTETGQPLGHASITGVRFDHGGSLVDAVADVSGHYSIAGLAPGDYKLYFSCGATNGCSGNYVPEFWDDQPYPISADRVTVTSGATTSGIDAALAPAGTISGTVTGEAGEPLPNVPVQVYQLESDGTWYLAGGNITNANGEYAITRLAANDYKVGFATCVYTSRCLDYIPQYFDDRPDLDSADLVSVTSGEVTGGIDATLESATKGSISGTVTGGSGQPLQGVRVDVYAADLGYGDWRSVGNAATDAGGHYTVGGLRTGDDKVGFNSCTGCDPNYLPRYSGGTEDLDSADLVPVTSGSDTGGVDAALPDSGSISGTVTDELGTPLSGVGVSAYVPDTTFGFPSWALAAGASTDAAGHYRLAGLAGGQYRLQFGDTSTSPYVYDDYHHQPDLDSADPVTVTAGVATTGVDESLPRGTGVISGTVTDGVGQPVGGAVVQLYERNAAGGWTLRVPSTPTDGAGAYSIGGLATGDYKVLFGPHGNLSHPCGPTRYAPVYYDGRPDFASAAVVAVTAGSSTSGIDGSLAAAGGCISGTVTGSFGQPLAGIDVNVWQRDGASGGWQYLGSVDTNGAGAYTFGGLASGDYQVGFNNGSCLFGCTGGWAPEYYDGRGDPAAADVVTVTAGSTTSGIDASLALGGIVAGEVTNERGQSLGLTSTEVFLERRGSDGAWNLGAFAAAYSSYSAGGLAAGTYRMFFLPPPTGDRGIYQSQYYDGQPDAASADPVPVTAAGTASGIDAVLIFKDRDPPRVTVAAPAAAVSTGPAVAAVATSSPLLTADYGDGTGLGIDRSTARVLLDENDVTAGCSVGISSLSCSTQGLADGPHDLTVEIDDLAGHTGSASRTFTVSTAGPPDTTPPVTTDDAPSGPQSAPFTVTLTCSDGSGGSGCKETHFRLDGGPDTVGTAVAITTAGDHTIAYHSVDEAGNVEPEHTVHAELEAAAPPPAAPIPTLAPGALALLALLLAAAGGWTVARR